MSGGLIIASGLAFVRVFLGLVVFEVVMLARLSPVSTAARGSSSPGQISLQPRAYLSI